MAKSATTKKAPAKAAKPAPAPQRNPKRDDCAKAIEIVAEGKSLRAACRALGLHCPTTNTTINADTSRGGLRDLYTAAKEMRAEHFQEEMLTVTKAAALGIKVDGKKVDPAGARAYADAIKWAHGRMAPKLEPVHRIDVTSRTRQMSDDEIAAELAALGSEEPEAEA